MSTRFGKIPVRRATALALAVVTAIGLAFPPMALAKVVVDDQELVKGKNSVGGGTATLMQKKLEMADVKAANVKLDEDLKVDFVGGNDIEVLDIEGSANVELNYTGENEVEDTHIFNEAKVTINADGHDSFEEVEASDNASVTVNVTGENDFETIEAKDNASIVVRGTDCQKRDKITIGDDESNGEISAEAGDVTIDHVTVELESKTARVGSESGNVKIDTSKIEADDDTEYVEIFAGGTMEITESVIEITGTVHSDGEMTIEHSDIEAEAPDASYDDSPYRVYSKTGIELIREDNGEVKAGELDDEKVWYVDTGDGEDVDLEADGDPGYYACKSEPKTGDDFDPRGLSILALASAATAGFSARRYRNEAAAPAGKTIA